MMLYQRRLAVGEANFVGTLCFSREKPVVAYRCTDRANKILLFLRFSHQKGLFLCSIQENYDLAYLDTSVKVPIQSI